MYGQIHKSPERRKGKPLQLLLFEKSWEEKENIINDDLDVMIVKIPRITPRYREYYQRGLSTVSFHGTQLLSYRAESIEFHDFRFA